ncbi:MAG TPA: PmoA family protein [Bryobacteraceae bacterium]|nr:PmoA family protein [Bryobacteraceae bacterium]
MKPLFIMLLAAALAPAQVRFSKAADHIDIQIDGRPFATFWYSSAVPKPYLAPIRAASGTIVTRQWPMDPASKESHEHPHHRGLFFGYINVNGVDFWGNDPLAHEKNPGTISLRQLEQVKDGDHAGTIHAIFDWKDPQGKPVLAEDRTMTFYSDPRLRTIDVDIVLTAAVDTTFYDDKDGAFAFRMADALNEDHTGTLVNAEGAEHEKNTWGHRSPWMDYYGTIGSKKLGVAIFDHPSNPGYPNRWHCRGYGLFSMNPFAQHAFDPALPEKHTPLAKGASMHYLWRVVIHPGDVHTADIAGLYRAWTGQK